MADVMLGIHVGHDASACLIDRHGIIIHLREEQITKIKHFNGFPSKSIVEIGRILGSRRVILISFSTVGPLFDPTENSFVIDLEGNVKRYDEYHRNVHEELAQRRRSLENSYFHFQERLHFSERSLAALSKIGVDEDTPRFYVHHHLSHASCFRLLGKEYTKALTADGRGDNVSSTAYSIADNGNISLMRSRGSNESLGALYQCATEVAGYLGVDSEYKIMGLSAYGKYNKEWVERLRALLREENCWKWTPYSIQYPERSKNNPLNAVVPPYLIYESYKYLGKEDFAATIQKLFEEEIIKIVSMSIVKGDFIFCSGGAFLNTKCNRELQEYFRSAKFDFFPDSADSGLSIGSVMAAAGFSNPRPFSPFVGQGDGFKRYQDYLIARGSCYIHDSLDLPALVTELLDGKFLGLCDGRAEIGPRALGGRPIIANAFSKHVQVDLNKRKRREMFVPVAPSILVSDAEKLIYADGDEYYMIKNVRAKDMMAKIAPGVVHADGTVRPQLVDDDDSSLIANILREIKRRRGFGIVANSSLNRAGYPTAGDINEALDCLDEGIVDIIVNRDVVVRRHGGCRLS